MSTATHTAHALRDARTMVRRNLLHARRYPSLTLNVLLTPVVLLLLFVYVLGDTLSAGITGEADRTAYVAYLVPGILLMTVAGTALGTAVSVCNDMTEGIVARFRTMAISRSSVLIGHVVGSLLQTLGALVMVGGIALAIGFRSDANPLEWLAAVLLLTATSVTTIWLAVGVGLSSPNPEAASNNGLPLLLLPFLSSAFVPLDAMPAWFRWFAEYQPFTPAIETLRGLLLGEAIGHQGWLAAGWCLVLTVLGYRWALALYRRDPAR
ncbi:ABC transporter permease [Streptomyces sp. 3MP-14]|uniref:Transport permease protein n=1 Tax=Streptomyces mimosae TaxID=2586635 RepID=A0A5N6A619_9ACTN|nr:MULTISPECIES: ABC transporter permease [Streptomyces]KAB8163366.1 ABC transporter permease [Streptomyces mimosae]KAB8174643.1 ABC transporter permease [Streptomyces sp. 3MP-14]